MSQTIIQHASPWWRKGHFWLLAVLAAQYAIFQLATGVEYLDAQRNMQWGIYALEQPRFLIGAPNIYDRINGFMPSPATLAPAGMVTATGGPLSPWWGPLYLLLFGVIWQLTGSYTALQLIGPLAAGACVVLTYAFGRRCFDERVGLLAAVLLALFPVYREHAVLALVEPLSALLLGGALWAWLVRRPAVTVLLGTLAMLGKPDMVAIYYGTISLTALLSWRDPDRPIQLRQLLACLGLPLLAIVPWFYVVYFTQHRPATIGGGPSLSIFLVIAPLMLDQFFTVKPFVTVLTLGILLGLAGLAVLRRRPGMAMVYRLLVVWFACGCVVLVGYALMPGASNNPRVLIPALPALCLLVADGLVRLSPRLWRPVLTYLLVLFLLVNGVGIWYQLIQARALRGMMPVWEALRGEPRGFVLTEEYWSAALYARQPATWFEHDPVFQRNIMQHLDNFDRYIETAPIRYVVLPRDPRGFVASRAAAVAGYASLPIGRDLGWPDEPLVSADVLDYLKGHFPQRTVGDYVIFTIERQYSSAE